jgi:hypothetical protein
LARRLPDGPTRHPSYSRQIVEKTARSRPPRKTNLLIMEDGQPTPTHGLGKIGKVACDRKFRCQNEQKGLKRTQLVGKGSESLGESWIGLSSQCQG